MKAAFISDIHGNSVALQAVLEDIEGKAVDQICVLGDLCYRGPDPKGALELVRSLHAMAIKGNADVWVVRGIRQGEVSDSVIDIMNAERDWTVSQLEQPNIEFLRRLPADLRLDLGGALVHAFHATPDSLFEIVSPDTEEETLNAKLMSASDADIFVYAHVHKPFIRYIQGKVLINIGSVGLPFDGMTKASYGVVEVEDGKITASIERVPFDVEKVVRQMERLSYPNTDQLVNILRTARAQ